MSEQLPVLWRCNPETDQPSQQVAIQVCLG